MRNYWTCTKFADWVRGVKKPAYASGENWAKWEEDAKKLHPIRFWLAEECLEFIQDTLYKPIDFIYNIKYSLVNRFITKTHALTAFSLPKGEYHEIDTRIIHCLFDELVNFVEIEKAWLYVWCHDGDEFKSPWYAAGWFRTRTWRSPEAGLKYLKWEQSLTNDDGTPSDQAINAEEIESLYRWWVYDRPERPDPMDESGWSDYCSKNHWNDPKSEEDEEITRKMILASYDLEEEYDKEDENQLIRLIKIRKSLWT